MFILTNIKNKDRALFRINLTKSFSRVEAEKNLF